MEIKKAIIGKKQHDVVSQEEYERRASLGDPNMLVDTVIEHRGTLYPVYNSVDSTRENPYAINRGMATKYFGTAEKNPEYSDKSIINFSDITSNKELLERQSRLHSEQAALLTSSANKDFAPIIREDDSPALKLVKECLHAKHIDIDCYRSQFESNCEFSNAIRLLINADNHNISVQKIQMIGEKFGIEFEISAKDARGVVNPMGQVFSREL